MCACGLALSCGGIDQAGDEGAAATTGGSSGTTAGSAGSSTDGGDPSTSDGSSSESTAAVDADSGSSETTSSPPEIECDWFPRPSGEREWGRCTPASTWDDAEAHCVDLGGHLVSFASASDNLFAINVLGGSGEAWIGLSDQGRAEVYEWTDGTPYDYVNWEDGQPDARADRCVAIGNSQRWFDYPCEEGRTFLCARPL